MVKSNELRIGNLLHADREAGRFVAVAEIRETKIIVHDNDWSGLKHDELSPIPLTPEWLRKFGFEEEKYFKGTHSFGDFSIVASDFQPVVMGYDDFVRFGKPQQFVHQLQNLFYALTGEELTIKEPA